MDVYTRGHGLEHIKRPLNSFMVWAKEKRRIMNKNNPKMRNADISKILGEEWRKMNEEDKQPYVQQAMYLRRQHKIDYPNYRYRPRRKSNQDPNDQRPPPYTRMYSNVFLPNSSNALQGGHLPYGYDSYLPPLYTMDRIDIQHGPPYQHKILQPTYNPSYLFMTTGMKERPSPLDCASTFKDNDETVTSFPSTSTYSPTLPYMMLPAKK